MVGAGRWLWRDHGSAARLTRLALLPAAGAYLTAMRCRTWAYRSGRLKRTRPDLPCVAVGNLSVGGTGKTPLCAWIAARYAAAHIPPAVVLRGYGNDEAQWYREQLGAEMVFASPNRLAAIRQARDRGVRVAVLDDAYQRLDVAPGLTIAMLSTEEAAAPSWPLPAGPWREDLSALDRADLIVVTRRVAEVADASALAIRVGRYAPSIPVARAHLALGHLQGMRTGRRFPVEHLAGRRVFAVCGIADPDSFAGQLRALGASVRLRAWPDHHPYNATDMQVVLEGATTVDYVVVTAKDAVKLRAQWPARRPEPLVATVRVVWEQGADLVTTALDSVVEGVRQPIPG